MEDLNKVLDKVIEERTFSLEAVEAIKRLREELDVTKVKLTELNLDYESLKSDFNSLEQFKEQSDSEIKGWSNRFKELKEREKRITDLEKSEAVASVSYDVASRFLDALLKNTVFREQTQKTLATPVKGGSGSGGYTQLDNVTETTQKETE